MARTNKYTSLNFNDIYENKKPTTSSSSSSIPSTTKTILSNSRIHGNMLVLTRPSPKPIPPPQPATHLQDPPLIVKDSISQDSISLRPLGRTGSPSPLTNLPNLTVNVSPKTNNKFVPPHLRPGFHGKEEKPEVEVQKQRSGFRQSGLGSPVGYVEEGRPKSGGGYERGRGGFEKNLMAVNRPRSSGSNRPYSSG